MISEAIVELRMAHLSALVTGKFHRRTDLYAFFAIANHLPPFPVRQLHLLQFLLAMFYSRVILSISQKLFVSQLCDVVERCVSGGLRQLS